MISNLIEAALLMWLLVELFRGGARIPRG